MPPSELNIIERGICKNCNLDILKVKWPTSVENWTHVEGQEGISDGCHIHCPGKSPNPDANLCICSTRGTGHRVGDPIAEPKETVLA